MNVKQRRILDFITGFIAEHRVSPSYREIAAGIGDKSTSQLHHCVKCLIADGHLRQTERRKRTLALGRDLDSVPTAALLAELRRRGIAT